MFTLRQKNNTVITVKYEVYATTLKKINMILKAINVVDVSVIGLQGHARPSPRPRGSARRKTASSLILRGHF